MTLRKEASEYLIDCLLISYVILLNFVTYMCLPPLIMGVLSNRLDSTKEIQA